jgi:hypothetical protein
VPHGMPFVVGASPLIPAATFRFRKTTSRFSLDDEAPADFAWSVAAVKLQSGSHFCCGQNCRQGTRSVGVAADSGDDVRRADAGLRSRQPAVVVRGVPPRTDRHGAAADDGRGAADLRPRRFATTSDVCCVAGSHRTSSLSAPLVNAQQYYFVLTVRGRAGVGAKRNPAARFATKELNTQQPARLS